MKTVKKQKKIWLRRGIQAFFFLFIALVAVNHQLSENGGGIPFLSNASLHALCPFGGVVSIYQYLTTGTFVQKIHESSFILMLLGFLLALLFGPVFCGWVCPLGTVQEWFSGIGKRIFKRRFNRFIPYHIDRYLRYLRYGVLVWVLYMTAYSGKLIFAEVDPYFALFNFWSSEVAIGGVIILLLTLVLSLFVERPWCKYACPYGALLGLFNLIRIFKIRRNKHTCISCGACSRVCPMNIPVMDNDVVKNHQCISCLECTSEAACPVSDTVVLGLGGK